MNQMPIVMQKVYSAGIDMVIAGPFAATTRQVDIAQYEAIFTSVRNPTGGRG